MRIGRHVCVTGRVQGVFFRGWTMDQARELGVQGWVRNRPDGSVEAHLSGEQAAVEQLMNRMRTGPSAARVEQLSAEDVAPEDCDSFELRR